MARTTETKRSYWMGNANSYPEAIWNAFWKLPKTRRGWLRLAGSTIGDYAITRQKSHWENLTQGFDSMNPMYLGKGAGILIASWIKAQRDVSLSAHLARVEAIVVALDEVSLTPLEKAIHRFVASKVALALEGYTSKLGEKEPRYQKYQKQVKILLATMPLKNYHGISQKGVYLGEPFHPESLFVICHRFLDAAMVEKDGEALQAFLLAWQAKSPGKPEDFYAQLLSMTHRQEDGDALTQVFETWFHEYRGFMLDRVEERERWMNKGMDLIEGRWLWKWPFSKPN